MRKPRTSAWTGSFISGFTAPALRNSTLVYTYDSAKHQVALTVKQTQKVEGQVGIFHVPVDVEITTRPARSSIPFMVTKDVETFTFPSDAAPLMVLFDKGGYLLKTADFHKEKKEWLYQLKNAAEFADRADAVVALGKIKNDDEVVAALATRLNTDKAWGIRAISADTLGRIGGPAALKHLVDALNTNDLARRAVSHRWRHGRVQG